MQVLWNVLWYTSQTPDKARVFDLSAERGIPGLSAIEIRP